MAASRVSCPWPWLMNPARSVIWPISEAASARPGRRGPARPAPHPGQTALLNTYSNHPTRHRQNRVADDSRRTRTRDSVRPGRLVSPRCRAPGPGSRTSRRPARSSQGPDVPPRRLWAMSLSPESHVPDVWPPRARRAPRPGELGPGRQLRGHPAGRQRGRHRQDHHQPPRGAQRVSPETIFELPRLRRRAGRPAIGVGCSPARARTRSARAATSASGATAAMSTRRRRAGRLNVLDLQRQIRLLPKPVIAVVAGYAIGGGHVLHVVCDLTIAADNARFGQTGPRVGSFRRRLRRRRCWRGWSATRRPRRSGSCVASTTPRKRWTWAWSTSSSRWRSWRARR